MTTHTFKPDLPAPSRNIGVVGWLRANLFSNWLNTLLTLVGLSVRTAVAFASGSTFLYFLQPVLNNTVVALLFLISLATARPVVARLAADFFPMTDDIAKRLFISEHTVRSHVKSLLRKLGVEPWVAHFFAFLMAVWGELPVGSGRERRQELRGEELEAVRGAFVGGRFARAREAVRELFAEVFELISHGPGRV